MFEGEKIAWPRKSIFGTCRLGGIVSTFGHFIDGSELLDKWFVNLLKLDVLGPDDEAFKSGWIVESRD